MPMYTYHGKPVQILRHQGPFVVVRINWKGRPVRLQMKELVAVPDTDEASPVERDIIDALQMRDWDEVVRILARERMLPVYPINPAAVCPECHHVFQGGTWGGIDAHWRAHHQHLMPYSRALFAAIKAGTYTRGVK